MTAQEILRIIKLEYLDKRQWAFFEELRVGTGFRNVRKGINPEQRIDAWVINCYPSKKFERIAFEIKVSRSDFLCEINNPEKRQQALVLSNKFYFAAPKGLIGLDEVPEECGLVEFEDGKFCKWTKKAPWRDTDNPGWQFVASICRRQLRP